MFCYKINFNTKQMFKLVARLFSTKGKSAAPDKLSSDFIKAVKNQFVPEKIPKISESKFGNINIVTLITENNEKLAKGAEYINSIIDALRAPISLENIVLNRNNPKQAAEDIYALNRNRAAIKLSLSHDHRAKREQFVMSKALDLYASIIRLNSYKGFNYRFPNLNLMLVIQNISDDFTQLEYEPVKGIIKTLVHSTADDMYRFLCFVYETVRFEKRKKITFVHNMEKLPKTDGHFVDIAKSIGEDYPDIEVEFQPFNYVVRNLTWQPHIFDVLCSNQRYGTVITTIAASVAGGPLLYSCIEQGGEHAIFKPLHTKLSLTEYDAVSAYGILNLLIDLTRYLCLEQHALKLYAELNNVIEAGLRTQDFGGCATYDEIICHVIEKLNQYDDFPKDLPAALNDECV